MPFWKRTKQAPIENPLIPRKKKKSRLGKIWNKISRKPTYKKSKYITSTNAQALLNPDHSYDIQNGKNIIGFEKTAVYVPKPSPQIRNHRPLIQEVMRAGNAYQKNKTVETRKNLLDKIDALINIVDETKKEKLRVYKAAINVDFKKQLQKEINDYVRMYKAREGKKKLMQEVMKKNKKNNNVLNTTNRAWKQIRKDLKAKLEQTNKTGLNLTQLNKTDYYGENT
jgi:hypothetical protein